MSVSVIYIWKKNLKLFFSASAHVSVDKAEFDGKVVSRKMGIGLGKLESGEEVRKPYPLDLSIFHMPSGTQPQTWTPWCKPMKLTPCRKPNHTDTLMPYKHPTQTLPFTPTDTDTLLHTHKNMTPQCLSQDLETGCLKLAVVKSLGVQIFKGDHNILIFQP